jgi:cytochrome c biogenesis protein CcdA/glutaredoxin
MLGALIATLLGLAALLAWTPAPARAVDRTIDLATVEDVTLLLFHGEGCPHCASERAWLEQLAPLYPELRIEQYEVWNDADNRVLLQTYAEQLGFEPSGVPVTIVGENVWIGFSEPIAGQIEAVVAAELAAGSTEPTPAPSDPTAGPTAEPTTPTAPGAEAAGEQAVEIPLVGSVSLADSSLVVSTLLIGFADGINPCSLWVLAVLLAIVLHSGSRGRVLLVGSTFLVVTAAMYGLYIAGMYSALDYAQGITWIRVVVAAVALAFGVLQLKDGIAPGVGPSLSISPTRRPRLYGAMRGLAREDRGILPTLAGTVVLAVGVSLLETPCTAGLPLLWTSMLADQQVALGAALALFALYMAVFLLDELALFGAAVVTMRARRLQPEQGRLLKIVSGSLLVTLAVTMIVVPEAMTGLASSLAVFAVAAVLALIVWLAVRNRAPRAAEARHP